MKTQVRRTSSAEETVELGRKLAAGLNPGDVVAFFGDLGTGKTTMIKGIADGLQVREVVRSPSFVIATEYEGRRAGQRLRVYHIDLYRLHDAGELHDIGFADYFSPDAITLIEWADRAQLDLPARTIRVELVVKDRGCREISVTPADRGERLRE